MHIQGSIWEMDKWKLKGMGLWLFWFLLQLDRVSKRDKKRYNLALCSDLVLTIRVSLTHNVLNTLVICISKIFFGQIVKDVKNVKVREYLLLSWVIPVLKGLAIAMTMRMCYIFIIVQTGSIHWSHALPFIPKAEHKLGQNHK